jgi:superfamily II DNA/RNA helicase
MKENVSISLERLKRGDTLSSDDLEQLLVQTYRLLDSSDEDEYNLCLSVICHVADLNFEDLLIQQLLHDTIVKSRIFLYDKLLHDRQASFDPQISSQDILAQSFYTSGNTNTTLTKPQKEIFDLFQEHRRVLVSAPTSFGKTRIVREIIAHNDYKNIVLIMPTVSLLSEQFNELRNSISEEEYFISKSSKVQIDSSKKYILILTPERMNVFLEENPDFQVDFFVMDEIYKVDFKLKDDRFQVFADILYQLASTKADFYLIGPYINNFSDKFCTLFNVKKKIVTLEIVQKDFFNLDHISERRVHDIEDGKIRIIEDRFENLQRLISEESIDGKYLIYRYQKQYVEESAIKLTHKWPTMPHNEELVEYLSETVSSDWDLIKCIKRNVAFHHGAMPRYVQDLVVDEFNNATETGIRYLFCTTSLTEGVNTSAKNVVLFDTKIGKGDRLKTLDRKNIEGRAGRFMRHFVGRVFYLEDHDQEEEETNVEIDMLDNPNPSAETILQTNDENLSERNLREKKDLEEQLRSIDVPLSLIKSNKFVSVSGQIGIINYLRSHNLSDFYFSGSIPEKDVTRAMLSIIYDHLFTEGNKGRNFDNEVGKSILIGLTNYYIYKTPTFKELLNSSTVQRARTNVNAQIRYVFDLTSKYFEFVWPRYIKVFANLYNFVAEERGKEKINLDMVIATLEYGTTEQHEILLKDAGVPNEIIRKISKRFAGCETFEEIQTKKKEDAEILKEEIHPIEVRVLDRYI